ncbi:MAG: iron ABC transporter permease [Clostridiaceae bacterium]|jgi:iron complex transport system permease protein|nr:iron ABC transporter permease [Clostridiaceae bacterium]
MKNTTSGKTGKKTVAASIMGGFGVLLFIVVFFFSVSTGSVGFSFTDVVRVLAGYLLGLGDTGDIPESLVTIIINVRLPRVILSALAGAALSISGAAMQGLLKNPLADGSTLGITSGGALGAVISIAAGFNLPFFPNLGLVFMSILFSFLSLILILTLTYKIDYNLSNQTIILNGVIFSMLASSITSLIVSLSGNNLKQVVFWTMGSFSGRGWSYVVLMLPFFVAGAVPLLFLSRELDAFSLGEEQAEYIGVNTKKVKLLILILVSVLTGVSVAVSGTIGFVGLVIPHMTRFIAGPNHKKLLPVSALFGAGFLMATDLLSRTILSPAELPIGVVTSLIGAILFIYIFYSRTGVKG